MYTLLIHISFRCSVGSETSLVLAQKTPLQQLATMSFVILETMIGLLDGGYEVCRMGRAQGGP